MILIAIFGEIAKTNSFVIQGVSENNSQAKEDLFIIANCEKCATSF